MKRAKDKMSDGARQHLATAVSCMNTDLLGIIDDLQGIAKDLREEPEDAKRELVVAYEEDRSVILTPLNEGGFKLKAAISPTQSYVFTVAPEGRAPKDTKRGKKPKVLKGTDFEMIPFGQYHGVFKEAIQNIIESAMYGGETLILADTDTGHHVAAFVDDEDENDMRCLWAAMTMDDAKILLRAPANGYGTKLCEYLGIGH